MAEESPSRAIRFLSYAPLFCVGSIAFYIVNSNAWFSMLGPCESAGILIQALWDSFLQRVGDNAKYKLYVYGTTIWTVAFYWIVGSIYIFMDFLNYPRWTRKYKIQPGTNEPVDTNKLLTAIGNVLFNQIILGIPITMLCFWIAPNPAIYTLPSINRMVIEWLVFYLVEEVVFYYSHRLLHHPKLYKHIHKIHHEWTSPIAVMSLYAHPIEHIMSNILPVAMGPAIMSSHIVIAWLWYARSILRSFNHHSGYHFPGFPSPEAHDFHHLKFTECFGLMGLLDYLHGTDKGFRLTSYYKRHKVSFKLEPLRLQFPDVDKSKFPK